MRSERLELVEPTWPLSQKVIPVANRAEAPGSISLEYIAGALVCLGTRKFVR